jgi:glutamate--cysteine ligase
VHLVDEKDAVPIRSHDELISYFSTAGKPASQWRVGTEHELVGVHSSPPSAAGQPPTYEGPRGIGALFDWFAARGGKRVVEGDHTIALQRDNGEQLTIEPGGQFELAARPVEDDCSFNQDLCRYLRELGEASKPLDITWLSTGLRPFAKREDVPLMPKQRYDVMRAYMPTVGTRGLDMMLRTATVQANLDFADEADATAKLRCLYSITSILTALWANSPIAEDRPTGLQTYRAWIWRDTDNARAGLLPFVFEDRDDIFHTYTEWALDVPLYFIYRDGYKPVPGGFTFRQYMRDGYEGEQATMADWAMHLSTLFPEGRLKKFIEVRGCDCGSIEMISALPALMRGVLYDATARDAATKLTAGMSFADRQRLADDVPSQGLAARAGEHTLGELARELVAIGHDGLSRVAPASMKLLAPVEAIAKSGVTQADQMVALWQRAAGDRMALVRALSHPGLLSA